MVIKKDFVAIAEIIKDELEFATTVKGHCLNCSYRIRTLTSNLADYFEKQNPNFDRWRFLRACGLDVS